MTRVAIGNNKGGSGKSATTVNLADALAARGHRVLVVDLDPQANASRRLGWAWDPNNPTPTLVEAVQAGTEGVAAQVITSIGWDLPHASRIALAPSRFDLENRVSEAGVVGALGRLDRALDGVTDAYDYTLIDCPPSLGHLTQLALAAADVALATVEPERDGLEGAVRFRDFIDANKQHLANPELRLVGAIPCRVRAGLKSHDHHMDQIPRLFPDAVWEPAVPERTVIKDAADEGLPLAAMGSRATEVIALYAKLADRLTTEIPQ
ncbi:AAA family ATPase [Streptomyces alkaliphilus]|uniref:AAA family ATPase n=1 Tax=Streptomyces alkaliphilus TaxID=1472722 RepID=A0A7W3Y435_9ACTN|nr:AAA family ATPase [Streptomyces alkaliphilus]MBB0247015.1 AAA family ATPase [Streptomyces alkaliphilus]